MATDTADTAGSHGVTVEEDPEPPAPDAVFAVVNPLMKAILRSPLHGLVSGSLLTLEFTGRKSGDTYRTPVGYTRFGDTLYLFTHSPWWHNFEEPAEVVVRLEGERRTGMATAYPDPEEVAERVLRVIESEGVEVTRRIGLEIEGEGVPEEGAIVAAVEETVAIEIELTG